MINIKTIVNSIKKYKFKFCNKLFINKIYETVYKLLPNLNVKDSNILGILTSYLIDEISYKIILKK